MSTHRRRWLARTLAGAALLIVVVVGGASGYVWWVFSASRPTLDGSLKLAGLAADVQITRDADGVPTLTATNRPDLARAMGFLHAQERFFQMDLLRRAGAGELSELVGPAALEIDRARRLHRFRARAQAALAAQNPADRTLLAAYTAGVNAGLAALGHAPWEYTLLRVTPAAWTEADTTLVVFAMYFDLEDSDADNQLEAAREQHVLGPALANFLYPRGVPADAPLDGSHLPEPPLPPAPSGAAAPAGTAPPAPEKGSNNFAVAGNLSETGAAMVENDMHLDLRVPDIWYRARLRIGNELDMTGVTLPGVPFVVVGSNTHIAWAFTDSYIETGDAVVIETPPGDPDHYKTPDGTKPFETYIEKICAAHAGCEGLTVQDTIWGPVVGQDDNGHKIAWRWIAHDPGAVNLAGSLGLESARSVRAALDVAHTAGMPDQNFVVGDSDGHIAWTIIGQVPRRVGLNDQLPHSWADGTHTWNGYLPAAEIPEIVDPPDGRLWTANARTLGGDKYQLLGDGFFGNPARARAIHDDLFARQKFAEIDMLAIATDDRAHLLDPWQGELAGAIAAHKGDANVAALAPYVADWGGRAEPGSVGYRLVREFRGAVISRIYTGLAGALAAAPGAAVPLANLSDYPSLRLLAARPAWLVPKPFASWDALIAASLNAVASNAAAAPGGAASYNWGVRNHTGIHHPLARAVPLLGWLTDPPDVPVAGDALVPRVAIPGFGSSERLVVSPGHEDRAIFDMPVGQSDNPLAPYYGAGEAAWVEGRATPLLPGGEKWRLVLRAQ
jgi:penicillin amidase